jgi:hypothetical protein
MAETVAGQQAVRAELSAVRAERAVPRRQHESTQEACRDPDAVDLTAEREGTGNEEVVVPACQRGRVRAGYAFELEVVANAEAVTSRQRLREPANSLGRWLTWSDRTTEREAAQVSPATRTSRQVGGG